MDDKERNNKNKHNLDSVKYIKKELVAKGKQRLERHPSDGSSLTRLPKSGHGGKYTWEGPGDAAENELEAAPPVTDEKDPNYVNEEVEERIVKGEDSEVGGMVVGEVEVAKTVEDKEGVARIEVHPTLQNLIH